MQGFFGPVAEMDRQVPDKRVVTAATAELTLTLFQRHAQVALGGVSGAVTVVNLPNLSEAKGHYFTVQSRGTAGSGETVNVKYSNGGTSGDSATIATTDILLDFFSNGRQWKVGRTAV